jgi:hypothetical protein
LPVSIISILSYISPLHLARGNASPRRENIFSISHWHSIRLPPAGLHAHSPGEERAADGTRSVDRDWDIGASSRRAKSSKLRSEDKIKSLAISDRSISYVQSHGF